MLFIKLCVCVLFNIQRISVGDGLKIESAFCIYDNGRMKLDNDMNEAAHGAWQIASL